MSWKIDGVIIVKIFQINYHLPKTLRNKERNERKYFFQKSLNLTDEFFLLSVLSFMRKIDDVCWTIFPNMENLCNQIRILKSFVLIGFMSDIKIVQINVILGTM